jgi:hypothetical protein
MKAPEEPMFRGISSKRGCDDNRQLCLQGLDREISRWQRCRKQDAFLLRVLRANYFINATNKNISCFRAPVLPVNPPKRRWQLSDAAIMDAESSYKLQAKSNIMHRHIAIRRSDTFISCSVCATKHVAAGCGSANEQTPIGVIYWTGAHDAKPKCVDTCA